VAGGKGSEEGGHFLGGVGIAGAVRDLDAGGERLAGLGMAGEPAVKLAELEISGDVVGVGAEKDVEIFDSGLVVARIGAFEGETVTGEGIVGLGGDEFLQFLPAGFCGLGRGHEGSIIGGLHLGAKGETWTNHFHCKVR